MGYLEDKELLERTFVVKHIYGLPVADGTQCDIYYSGEYISVIAGGMTFNLDYNIITDAAIKTDVEISKQYVSSAGGAVGGALLFGPVGAMIGGRTKEKVNREITNYLIITYLKGNEVSYLCFDVSMCVGRAENCIKSIKYASEGISKGVIDLGSGSLQSDIKTNTASKPVHNEDIGREISYARQREVLKKSKDINFGCAVFIVFLVMCIISIIWVEVETNNVSFGNKSATSTAISNDEEKIAPLFNAKAFIGENGIPINEQKLVEMIGQPDRIEEYFFTGLSETAYEIRALYYGNYEYKFCKDVLARISIYEPISYNSVDEFNDMFGVEKNSNSVVNNTGSAYRITNCGIHDLWIGYENGKTQWVHISYLSIFD